MRRLLALSCLLGTCFFSHAAYGQVIFNDNFNGTDQYTNNGAGAVNPTSSTTAYTGDIGGQGADGAYYDPNPNGFYSNQTMVSETGNTNSGSAYGLGTTGTNLDITASDVTVTANGGSRSDIPGSSDGGFRFELGIVSANAGYNDPELYNNGSGGVYVNLFYDKVGNLTGDLRLTNDTKSGGGDSSGTPGVIDVANFTLANGTSPVTVDFDLTSTGYSISFSQAVTSLNGSLSGTFAGAGITTEFDNGVRTSLFGQEWAGGSGSGYLSNVEIAVPEPSSFGLIGLGLAGLVLFGVLGNEKLRHV